MIKLIVGLGNNVNEQYIHTRHNLGYRYVQLLAQKYMVDFRKDNILFGDIGELNICNTIIRLLIPNSYINNSGISVSKCVNLYQLSLKEILIVHDELDLSPGKIRIKLGNKINESHHGIQDIINKLNKKFDFYRLRIGIGRPNHKSKVVNFVLSPPSILEKNQIEQSINKIILYTEDMIYCNFTKIMNKVNMNSFEISSANIYSI